jgi:oligopeptide/dipeptide ABC transporter ATP-binding protein
VIGASTGATPDRSAREQPRAVSGGGLQVRDLSVVYRQRRLAAYVAVRGISFSLSWGERVGVVGESGSGKSTLLLSIIQLLPKIADVTTGEIVLGGRNLLAMREHQLRRVRGSEIAMVFQNAHNALNPLITVGRQLEDVLVEKRGLTRPQARDESTAILEKLGIIDPARRANDYPFQFSGGMAQRVMLGLALASGPQVLLADEPTTGLDPLTSEPVLALLLETVQKLNAALLLVTHDINVIRTTCQQLVVMYAGEVLETGPTSVVLSQPAHPYTRALVAASRLRIDPKTGRVPFIPRRVSNIDGPVPGCSFSGRCSIEKELGNPAVCRNQRPLVGVLESGRTAACHFLDRCKEGFG